MQTIVTAAEAKKIDEFSIDEMGIPSLVLMERAALAVAECVLCFAKKTDKILVLCGSGNNGGDGMAAARILAQKNFCVQSELLGDWDRLSRKAKIQADILKKMSVPFVSDADFSDYDVVIDAVFGIGLSRPIEGKKRERIDSLNRSNATVVAADIPSGVDATTGQVLGIAVRADFTVTFGYVKRGLLLFPGAEYAGRVRIADIGLCAQAEKKFGLSTFSYQKEDVEALLPTRVPAGNKGSFGRVLVAAGSEAIGGAAYFSAAAAYCAGAGLVQVFTHENNRVFVQEKLPEALIATYSSAETPESFGKKFDAALSLATVLVIGPGIGTDDFAAVMLRRALALKDIPVVIDADGLNLLARCDKAFDENRHLILPHNFVLTPHLKELSRLAKTDVENIKKDLPTFTEQFSRNAVVAAKDACTVVSDGRQVYINSSGNVALAKGGSGDVLGGLVGGFLAQGMAPFAATALGVYLHGLTAQEYAKQNGVYSMTASDILISLKRLIKK